ncbi:hypothetical protein [Aurantimonas coralicida]|uniref:hypothetical protein n=1 Tax=Aurantimonas coralicida TaxID=182270 RepID=UPI002387D8D8|nr:hypothetical protein [Aurantimonas coralicida]MDE0922520.1 hypothetical protein [Aurantimonas coralicida]
MSAVRELDLGDRQMSLVKQVEANPVMVLLDERKFDEFYSEIEREVKAFEPDLSTVTSRKEIASLAYKVARTKTAIDEAGKLLTEDKRKEIKVVDASRKTIRDRLDALRDEARRPLDEWEAAEKARVEARDREMYELEQAAIVRSGEPLQEIQARLASFTGLTITADTHQEYAVRATKARDHGVTVLTEAIARIEREEAERAELEKLRAEAAERDRIEQERLAAEQAKREQAEATQREAERQAAAAEAERQRIAAAEERARREAAEAAEREKRAAEQRHADELRRIEEDRAAERRKAEQEAAAKAAAAKAEREAEEARQRDRAHRSKIMAAAKEAIMEAGTISEAKAKLIVSAIAAGSIPNVTLRF